MLNNFFTDLANLINVEVNALEGKEKWNAKIALTEFFLKLAERDFKFPLADLDVLMPEFNNDSLYKPLSDFPTKQQLSEAQEKQARIKAKIKEFNERIEVIQRYVNQCESSYTKFLYFYDLVKERTKIKVQANNLPPLQRTPIC